MKIPFLHVPEPEPPPHDGTDREPDLKGYRFGTWIVNEGLLRDEGTACGLTGDEQGIDGKLQAIEAFYEVAAVRADLDRSPLVGRAEAARHEREEAQAALREARERLRELEAAAAKGEASAPTVPQVLLRQAITMLLAGVAAVCSYVLVYEALADDFVRPAPVALAVLLGGTFLLFRPVSRLFGEDVAPDDAGDVRHADGWLQRVIELVPPLVAALFTCAWLLGERSHLEIALTGLFLFMLFLFSGKLALSALTVLSRAVVRRRAQQRAQAEAQRELEAQRRKADSAEEELRKAWGTEREALEALASKGDRREVEAVRDYKKALFLSEVSFASGARQTYDLVDVSTYDDAAEQD